jgi:ATPase family associated with various cellular activities (AAA)
MSSIFDVSLDIFKSSLPYLLINKSIDPILGLVLAPLLLFLAQRIVKYLRTPNYERDYSVSLRSVRNKARPNNNTQMMAVTWFLKEVIKFTACQYSDIGSRTEESDGEGLCYVIVQTFGNPRFIFETISVGINATFTEDKHNETSVISLTVPTRHQEIIKRFITQACTDYRKHVETLSNERRRSIRRVCTPNGFRWYSSDIKITKNFSNVFLDDKIKTDIMSDLDMFMANRDLYVRDGIPHKRGYLFYGPPGVGKTSIYYAIADRIKSDIYKLSLSQITTVAELMGLIRLIDPGTVVIIDDIDRIALTNKIEVVKIPRGNTSYSCSSYSLSEGDDRHDGNKSTKITIQSLLEIFDGYDHLSDCIIVFTTNNINKLDEALIRPGRIDRKYFIDLPNPNTMAAIFRHFYQIEIATMISPDLLASNRISSADIINTIILPNRNDVKVAVNLLSERLSLPSISPKREPKKLHKTKEPTVDPPIAVVDEATFKLPALEPELDGAVQHEKRD